MSISSIVNTITRIKKEISDISVSISQEIKKEVDLFSRINQIQRSMTGNMSPSTLSSKLSEIERKQKEIATISVRKSILSKKDAEKTAALLKAQMELSKEEERERKNASALRDREIKKEIDSERNRQREQINFQKRLKDEIHSTINFSKNVNQTMLENKIPALNYDLFISHASEDKDELVRPLAISLEKLGVKVWYDEFTLKVGDSLRRSIDSGLSNSRFGIVILSSSFFSKNWTQYELDGMVAKEISGGKNILPVWHKVTKDEVMKFSPSLADKLALNSAILSIEDIAQKLADVVLD